MDLGASNGIRLHFEEGLLSAVLLDLHRKPMLAAREELSGAGVQVEPLPFTDVDNTHVKQELGIGTRELELTESRNGQTTAVLRQRFSLHAPMDWRLQLNAAATLSEQCVSFDLPNDVKLTVEATESCVIEHNGATRVSLPEGSSEVTLTVISKPVFGVGDTIIVCRRDQMREVAIVVSCLPADRFTPIIPIDPPPMRQADYINLYNEFYQHQQATMSQLGGAMGRAEAESADDTSKRDLVDRALKMRAARSLLTPYRSWLKHNQMVSDLVSQLGIERAVFLHDFASEELNTTDPGQLASPASNDAGEAGPPSAKMFAGIQTRLDLSGVDLRELTDAAWRMLREQDGAPEHTIEVPFNDTASYVAALFTALRTGAVLSAADDPGTSVGSLFAEVNFDAEEAVLVEDSGDSVAALLGALYAHHRSARLVITPEPDLGPVQAVVADQQRKIMAAVEVLGPSLDAAEFAVALGRQLADDGSNPYAAVEAAVTAQVPPDVIIEVGERRLTAFTAGLPYSFVHTSEANWSHKPIGHVAADAALTILNELYSAGVERSAGAFSLVFDPGFFQASETRDVMWSVGAHFTHPILLSGPDANLSALMEFPRELPVELIFFNTHGWDGGIILDRPLSRADIVQWMDLSHRPIVFNNSCESWIGVGQEFIRVGARGYIGTLWSIPSALAADFARIVVDRLTAGEELACEAIANTSLPDLIERSYLYVGTANGRLDQWHDRVTTLGETALLECSMLANMIVRNDSQLQHPLRREINNLRRLVEGTPHERTLSYVDALLSELRLITSQEPPSENDIEAAYSLAERIDEALQRLDVPADQVSRRAAARFELTAGLSERLGFWREALSDFQRGLSYGDACPNRSGLLIQMATISMRQGDHDEALRQAHSAHDEAKEKQNKRGIVAALGLLGQLSKRLGRLDEAMDYTKQGYTQAIEIDDRYEQGTFKLDESFLHEMNGNFDAAIAAAAKALQLFRLSSNDRAELSAVGRLGACYREKGDLDAAERYAKEGLAQAEKLGIPVEVAAFHGDVGAILTLKDRHAEALPHYREAIGIFSQAGAWELCIGTVADLARSGSRLGDTETLWHAAIWGSQICEIVEKDKWSALLPVIIGSVKEAIEAGAPHVSESGISGLASVTMSEKPDEQPMQMRLLGAITFLLSRWISGADHSDITELADHLDSQTGNSFGLKDFVAVPYDQRTR